MLPSPVSSCSSSPLASRVCLLPPHRREWRHTSRLSAKPPDTEDLQCEAACLLHLHPKTPQATDLQACASRFHTCMNVCIEYYSSLLEPCNPACLAAATARDVLTLFFSRLLDRAATSLSTASSSGLFLPPSKGVGVWLPAYAFLVVAAPLPAESRRCLIGNT